MLAELRLTNFRIFDDEVTIRFRPITVLIGRNSSGKSSIIKFILMLQQSITQGGQQFLAPDGTNVSLGFFSDLKNSLTQKRNLMFNLTATSPQIEPDSSITDFVEATGGSAGSMAFAYSITGSISYSRTTVSGRTGYSLVDQKSGKEHISIIEHLSDNSSFLFPSLRLEDLEQREIRSLQDFESFQAAINKYQAEQATLNELRRQIRSIRHLSPVRAEFQRVILASNPPADYVGQSGEYALHHLQQMVSGDHDRYEFIVPHLRQVAGIESVDFETSSGGYVARAFARNIKTGADVLIADYGFGVGQCLPIFVQGAIMPPQSSLIVEQPEAQLHPTAQLALGNFFRDLWQERSIASIIETHSDNLLLRLRRLVARGELDQSDVSVAYFSNDPEDKNRPTVTNLDIYEDGTMQAGLPMEFFGADVIEGLRLGSRT